MGTGEESACSVLYNRRRWLTAQSSGKQQAVCTAVRAALVVCPEEGHFVRFQKRKFFAGAMVAVSRGSRQLRCPKVSKGRAESPLVSPQAHTPCPGWGLTRRLRCGSETWCPMERSPFSFDGERKGYKRKPAARRLQRRPAPLRVIRKYRRSGHCRARPLYLLRPVSR